ncbi:hypothetical protein QCA50_001878 [Cerrena zonata]|uniref:F-box domain-containing protein n=1 Tax=Cerrena zonata TaxID=2478898 RepID=A0AAW0GXW8_9APHY
MGIRLREPLIVLVHKCRHSRLFRLLKRQSRDQSIQTIPVSHRYLEFDYTLVLRCRFLFFFFCYLRHVYDNNSKTPKLEAPAKNRDKSEPSPSLVSKHSEELICRNMEIDGAYPLVGRYLEESSLNTQAADASRPIVLDPDSDTFEKSETIGKDSRMSFTSSSRVQRNSLTHPPILPTEVCEIIIDSVANIFDQNQRKDLAVCARVCRTWVARAQMHLFSLVYLSRSLDNLRHALQQKPFLLRFIKTIWVVTVDPDIDMNLTTLLIPHHMPNLQRYLMTY